MGYGAGVDGHLEVTDAVQSIKIEITAEIADIGGEETGLDPEGCRGTDGMRSCEGVRERWSWPVSERCERMRLCSRKETKNRKLLRPREKLSGGRMYIREGGTVGVGQSCTEKCQKN